MDIIENPVFEAILKRYVEETTNAFRRAVIAEGLQLSAEMLNSIRLGATQKGKDFIMGSVHYSMLLRIKDLKILNYTRMPPLAAMEDFVEKVGLDKFYHVPGYPEGIKPVSATQAIERIAWGIMQKRKREPNVVRGYRGVYNDPLKNQILPRFFADLRQQAGIEGVRLLKKMLA